MRGLWWTCVRGQRKEIKTTVSGRVEEGSVGTGSSGYVAKPRGLGSSAERQGSENRTQEQLGIVVLWAHSQDFKSVPGHGIGKSQKDSKEVM